ncbi:MAG: glycoside hydrolase family 6 protein [Patescibacteria group bacterium]
MKKNKSRQKRTASVSPVRFAYSNHLFVLGALIVVGVLIFGSDSFAAGKGGSANTSVDSAIIKSAKLYVKPGSHAELQAADWRLSRPADAAVMDKLALQPVGEWFGNWIPDVTAAVKSTVDASRANGTIPILVAYNIPYRDCALYSSGGSETSDAYKMWIRNFALGIGNRPAVVILEPDALASMSCIPLEGQTARTALINDAVSVLKALGSTSVYIDAGNNGWTSADVMATRLTNAGIKNASGFSLNVSNFFTTAESEIFGNAISKKLRGVHYVVDTSRNGIGSNGEWCNPAGRALGKTPIASSSNALVDAYLWIKIPGESDGPCNGGPAAGSWWADYALGLAKSAGW